MSNPISSATEEKTSAGKFNTETIIPEKFELTDEFKDTYNLINETDKNLFITGKAGCGKTLLAIAAGLEQTVEQGKFKTHV